MRKLESFPNDWRALQKHFESPRQCGDVGRAATRACLLLTTSTVTFCLTREKGPSSSRLGSYQDQTLALYFEEKHDRKTVPRSFWNEPKESWKLLYAAERPSSFLKFPDHPGECPPVVCAFVDPVGPVLDENERRVANQMTEFKTLLHDSLVYAVSIRETRPLNW